MRPVTKARRALLAIPLVLSLLVLSLFLLVPGIPAVAVDGGVSVLPRPAEVADQKSGESVLTASLSAPGPEAVSVSTESPTPVCASADDGAALDSAAADDGTEARNAASWNSASWNSGSLNITSSNSTSWPRRPGTPRP